MWADVSCTDLQHHLFSKTLGGRLYAAPIDQPNIRRILDAGTGTGVWAMDMGMPETLHEHEHLDSGTNAYKQEITFLKLK